MSADEMIDYLERSLPFRKAKQIYDSDERPSDYADFITMYAWYTNAELTDRALRHRSIRDIDGAERMKVKKNITDGIKRHADAFVRDHKSEWNPALFKDILRQHRDRIHVAYEPPFRFPKHGDLSTENSLDLTFIEERLVAGKKGTNSNPFPPQIDQKRWEEILRAFKKSPWNFDIDEVATAINDVTERSAFTNFFHQNLAQLDAVHGELPSRNHILASVITHIVLRPNNDNSPITSIIEDAKIYLSTGRITTPIRNLNSDGFLHSLVHGIEMREVMQHNQEHLLSDMDAAVRHFAEGSKEGALAMLDPANPRLKNRPLPEDMTSEKYVYHSLRWILQGWLCRETEKETLLGSLADALVAFLE